MREPKIKEFKLQALEDFKKKLLEILEYTEKSKHIPNVKIHQTKARLDELDDLFVDILPPINGQDSH